MFLVDCVKLLGSEVGKTIHHPSACGVEVSGGKHGEFFIKYIKFLSKNSLKKHFIHPLLLTKLLKEFEGDNNRHNLYFYVIFLKYQFYTKINY